MAAISTRRANYSRRANWSRCSPPRPDHYKKSTISRLPSACHVSYTARRKMGERARRRVAEETVYMRTTRKALEAVGGADALAESLGRPLAQIHDWLPGPEI